MQESKRRRCRGNAMLEAALMITMLLALLFAFIDFGLVLFIRASFQHAVREGARYAITYGTMSGMGQDDSIKTVVQNNSLGFLAGDTGKSKIFVRYYDPISFALTNYNGPGNLVEVSVEGYTWGWIVPMLRPGGTISIGARSSDRMEGLPGGQLPPTR